MCGACVTDVKVAGMESLDDKTVAALPRTQVTLFEGEDSYGRLMVRQRGLSVCSLPLVVCLFAAPCCRLDGLPVRVTRFGACCPCPRACAHTPCVAVCPRSDDAW